jgi:hypothetical protein
MNSPFQKAFQKERYKEELFPYCMEMFPGYTGILISSRESSFHLHSL